MKSSSARSLLLLLIFGFGNLSAGPIFFAFAEEAADENINTLDARLREKSATERANMKATEIADRTPRGEYQDQTYGLRIEIQKISKIDGGVEIFARAWKGKSQLGFGKDGSVEIERFRIFNPPILIPDPSGGIIREWTDETTGETKKLHLREDPVAAIQKDLASTIAVVGKNTGVIVPGKIGNTTSTYRPDADPESVTVDGSVIRNAVSEAWSSIRTNSGVDARPSDAVLNFFSIASAASTDNWEAMRRSIFLFDTASIPDTDAIDTATLSLTSDGGKADPGSLLPDIAVFSSNPASNTNLVSADLTTLGTTAYSDAITYSGWTASDGTANNFTLNSTGKAAINVSGVTKFGIRNKNYDADNTTPTWGASQNMYINGYAADQTGTTNDPRLVVQHYAGATTTAPSARVRKAATETLSSDTTTDDDASLGVYLSANKEYDVQGVIFASSTSQVPDIKVAFVVPTGAEMDIAVIPSSSEPGEFLQTSNTDTDGIPIPANQPVSIQITGTVKTSATAGGLKFQWSQNTSDAAAVGVLRGSYLRASEI